MSDWKSFACQKATSSFNEASASISETLRESGVNDVVASTTTNVKFYANSAYDMSATRHPTPPEYTTKAKDTMLGFTKSRSRAHLVEHGVYFRQRVEFNARVYGWCSHNRAVSS